VLVELEGKGLQPVVIFNRGGVCAPDVGGQRSVGARFLRVRGDWGGAGCEERSGGGEESARELAFCERGKMRVLLEDAQRRGDIGTDGLRQQLG